MGSYYEFINGNWEKSKRKNGMVYEKKKDPKTGFWEYAWHDQHCKGWKKA